MSQGKATGQGSDLRNLISYASSESDDGSDDGTETLLESLTSKSTGTASKDLGAGDRVCKKELAGPEKTNPITAADDTPPPPPRLPPPPPIPGVENWGIPPEPPGLCDPEVQAKFAQWERLMHEGMRFNEQLFQSKAYRNPHICAKLIEYLGLDETGSNYPAEVYDPKAFTPSAYAAEMAKLVEEAEELRKQQQAPGMRTSIAFEPSKPSEPSKPAGADSES
ncbi:SAP30-binding protein [Tieghemiomyces parasiticus]|uniref:SAP30-binding protein n=1 Tax=Tieghemiomyces parasiticus TaxID=78921 RepID=A0A9W8DXK1_9FUNG|nr:SAP30-binding protein [Tieghemiomyces parasiticus]